MEKTLHSKGYRLLLRRLREARRRAGVTQEELAARLGETQSFVSKCERDERRLDIVELRAFCKAMGVPFVGFVRRLRGRWSDELLSNRCGDSVLRTERHFLGVFGLLVLYGLLLRSAPSFCGRV